MDVSSESGPTERPRAKGAAPKPARKTLTTKKKTSSSLPVVVVMTPKSPVDVAAMIATAAFYLAAQRNFAPGHELDDWLEAERRVRGEVGGIP